MLSPEILVTFYGKSLQKHPRALFKPSQFPTIPWNSSSTYPLQECQTNPPSWQRHRHAHIISISKQFLKRFYNFLTTFHLKPPLQMREHTCLYQHPLTTHKIKTAEAKNLVSKDTNESWDRHYRIFQSPWNDKRCTSFSPSYITPYRLHFDNITTGLFQLPWLPFHEDPTNFWVIAHA